MMDKVRPLGTIKACNLHNRPPGAEEPVAASAPADLAQGETLIADTIAMPAHASRDHNIEAGRSGGPCCRQAVRAEIPIFRHEEEQLWPACRAWRRGLWRHVQRFGGIG